MAHPDTPAEQAHVDRSYARLDAMRTATEALVHEAFGERGGTFQSLAERDIRVRNGLNRLEHLQIGAEALIFGRIDNSDEDEAFHIGRLAVSDDDQEPLVVDWRAPVAEPFYRATGAHPMGLARRRHFLTQGRRVVDLDDELFDAEGTAGGRDLGLAGQDYDNAGPDSDGAGQDGEELSGQRVLFEALNRSRTGRMRDIVATVQKEQDEIIRSPLGGVLIVQGGPGTGKTAVALHRAAYLLYTHRFPLETQGVLVVGPNPLFLRYIDHVLPSLGETGVELSTIAGLYGELKTSGTEPPALARLKGDTRMVKLVARAVSARQRPLRRTITVPYGHRILRVTPEITAAVVTSAKRRAGTHNGRRRLVEQMMWREMLAQIDPDNEPVDETELRDVATELGRQLRRIPQMVEVLDRMWPLLRAPELLHDLFGAPPLIELAGRGVLSDEERAMLHRPRSASWEDVAWTPADAALLDEARSLLGPIRRKGDEDHPRTYGHVVVDEAQDLTPMELRMLSRRSLSGSMTVVGDVAQGISGWAIDSWANLAKNLPSRHGWRQAELTVNYRTPREVTTVAREVLRAVDASLTPSEAVRSTGEKPVVVRGDLDGAGGDVAEAVRAELAAVTGEGGEEGLVGVIVPWPLIDKVGAGLLSAEVPTGRGVAGGLDAPVTLVTVDEAKGLEFDSVVIVEPASLVEESPQGLRALYVALTRCTRRLVVVHERPLPESLAAGLAAADVL